MERFIYNGSCKSARLLYEFLCEHNINVYEYVRRSDGVILMQLDDINGEPNTLQESILVHDRLNPLRLVNETKTVPYITVIHPQQIFVLTAWDNRLHKYLSRAIAVGKKHRIFRKRNPKIKVPFGAKKGTR